MQELDCSRTTVKRIIQALRDELGAPLIYDRELNGYRYSDRNHVYELPGLWLDASELIALIASERLLAEVEPGVLAPLLKPLRERLHELLQRRQLTERYFIIKTTGTTTHGAM